MNTPRATFGATRSKYLGTNAPVAPPTDLKTYAEQLAPVVTAVLSHSAREDVEVLKAKIRNQKNLRDTFPEPIKTFYANNVRVLQAKLRAAEAAKREEAEDRRSTQEFKTLGKGLTGTGIAVGLAAVVTLIAVARAQNRANRSH